MAVFFSFHYERDYWRVQQVLKMGEVVGQPFLKAQEWESIRRQGELEIKSWIHKQMDNKVAVIVLIGSETASRPWVQYEIEYAWKKRIPLLGINIHGLSNQNGETDRPGHNPFLDLSGVGVYNNHVPIFDPTVTDGRGGIDSGATYNKIREQIVEWSHQGVKRQF